MAGGNDEKESPLPKRTRGSKAKNKAAVHDISSENSEDERDERFESSKNSGSDGFPEDQMQKFATMISAAMGTALASMTQNLSQNAVGQHPPNSRQDGDDGDKQNHDSEDDNNKNCMEDDEVDEYDRSIESLIGNEEKVGPEISGRIKRVLEKCIDPVLDDKAAKEKRELFPRPGNVDDLKVPRLNNIIYKKISSERQWVDRNLQQTQSFLLAGLTAVAYEAEHALKLRTWFNGLKDEEKEELPEGLARLGKGYVALMDATLLFTKTAADITSLRRKLVKNDLVEPYKSLFDDEKNPATAKWLAGDDVNGAIRKAKDTAFLADKITAKSSWPNSGGRKRLHSNERRNSRGSGGFGDFRANDRAGTKQDGRRFSFSSRGRGNGNRGRSDQPREEGRRDFYRRDSR